MGTVCLVPRFGALYWLLKRLEKAGELAAHSRGIQIIDESRWLAVLQGRYLYQVELNHVSQLFVTLCIDQRHAARIEIPDKEEPPQVATEDIFMGCSLAELRRETIWCASSTKSTAISCSIRLSAALYFVHVSDCGIAVDQGILHDCWNCRTVFSHVIDCVAIDCDLAQHLVRILHLTPFFPRCLNRGPWTDNVRHRRY